LFLRCQINRLLALLLFHFVIALSLFELFSRFFDHEQLLLQQLLLSEILSVLLDEVLSLWHWWLIVSELVKVLIYRALLSLIDIVNLLLFSFFLVLERIPF